MPSFNAAPSASVPPAPTFAARYAAGYDVDALGQVFTPDSVVAAMLALRRNRGRTLEPSCGDGAFSRHIPNCVALELDAAHAPAACLIQDFFAYPIDEKFDTVIGNPPYVRYRDILPGTRALLRSKLFDARSNLYLFFIEKAIRHLVDGGELIFVTPRDFLKATSSVQLNRWLLQQGAITDAIELGDARVFCDADPNCLIWRFEKGNFTRLTRYAEIGVKDDLEAKLAQPKWEQRHCVECAGHLMFARDDYPLRLSDIARVKVGAVSGADEIYADETHGNRDFVCAATAKTGQTRRMIWVEKNAPAPARLEPHKPRLIARGIRAFDENNWWHWGRGYPQTQAPRVYVNGKTRQDKPFFLHACKHFDGAVLAIFPHNQAIDMRKFRDALNAVAWDELGFVCDGRFLFSQRSLENAPLPERFAAFRPASL
ncbi:MAG TPA: class I SAM-dependent methyltransferase [Rhodocyclaceae bacterium]|nr:class I SAM-dependent methyltransferase [Rhodocyclaceae bacterium]